MAGKSGTVLTNRYNLTGWSLSLPDGTTVGPDYILSVAGRVHPYVRVGRERFTDRAQAYHAWKAAWEELLAAAMRAAGIREPFGGRLAVAFTFFTATRRADVDNLIKAAQDSANGVAWADDRTIDATAGWRFVVNGDQEATVIRVWRLDR